MNWQLLGPLLITTALAVGGWIVGHVLAARRDRANKRREQLIGYLIEAYRRLESSAHRRDQLDASKFESAVATQSAGQFQTAECLVQTLIAEFVAGGGAIMDDFD
ncbi:MAG TPA: hypothetical protein VJU77_13450 [Chthoniobacterales bacterium]|nr:hypothetical protein [Chthoniobacterales bacterium]